MLEDRLFRYAPEGASYVAEGGRFLSNAVDQLHGLGANFSVSVWVRPRNMPGGTSKDDLVRWYQPLPGGATSNIVAIGLKSGSGTTSFYFEVSDAAGTTLVEMTGGSPIVNNWYNVTVSKAGTGIILMFVNGRQVAQLLSGIPATTNVNRRISVGCDARDNTKFTFSDIHSIAVWEVPLTSEEMVAVYNSGHSSFDLKRRSVTYFGPKSSDQHGGAEPTSVLAHWWWLAQPGPANRFSADRGHTPIELTPVLDPLDDAEGLSTIGSPIGASLAFSGTSAVLRNSAAAAFGIANNWTISVWAKSRHPGPADRTIIHLGDSISAPTPLNRLILRQTATSASTMQVQLWSSTGVLLQDYTFNGILTLDKWIHIVLVWNGTSLFVYTQGVLRAPSITVANLPGAMTDSNRFLRVGSFPGDTNFWDDVIGHVGIWNTLLTSSEIFRLFLGGHYLDLRYKLKDYVSAESLLHYWKLGENPSNFGFDFISQLKSTGIDLSFISGDASRALVGNAPTNLQV